MFLCFFHHSRIRREFLINKKNVEIMFKEILKEFFINKKNVEIMFKEILKEFFINKKSIPNNI